MNFKTTHEPISIFSYSSLTDIVMLLVIFFLLTSQFVINTGVRVKLPGSKMNEQASPTRLIVTLTEGGGVYVGNEDIGIDALAGKLEAEKGLAEENNVIIRADQAVKIDLVIKVIDAAKGVGIDKFTIETERER